MDDVRTAQLGHPFNLGELEEHFQAVWAGVAWPGERPGFAVVVGLDRKRHFDGCDVILLEEYESFNIRQLVRQCGALDLKYAPTRWIGDRKNDAASRFIQEMNSECRETDRHEFAAGHGQFTMNWRESATDGRRFSLSSTPLIEMQDLYPYIVAQIAELTHKDRKQLWLKDGKAAAYLEPIQIGQTAELERGSFPAIEALGFAVIEARDRRAPIVLCEEDLGVTNLLET